MGIVKEFREFAMKGSVIYLAVGIVIGTAFGAVIKSLVDEVFMPIAGALLGGADFSDRFVVLRGGDSLAGGETLAQAREAGAVVIGYGQFLNVVLTFLIVAWSVFLVVKGVNRMRRRREVAPAETSSTRPCPECLSDIPRTASRCRACGIVVATTMPSP